MQLYAKNQVFFLGLLLSLIFEIGQLLFLSFLQPDAVGGYSYIYKTSDSSNLIFIFFFYFKFLLSKYQHSNV